MRMLKCKKKTVKAAQAAKRKNQRTTLISNLTNLQSLEQQEDEEHEVVNSLLSQEEEVKSRLIHWVNHKLREAEDEEEVEVQLLKARL